MENLRTLYEEIEPYDRGYIRVSPIHELYYEQCGTPNGKPVVFLHGGPGAGLVDRLPQAHPPDPPRPLTKRRVDPGAAGDPWPVGKGARVPVEPGGDVHCHVKR